MSTIEFGEGEFIFSKARYVYNVDTDYFDTVCEMYVREMDHSYEVTVDEYWFIGLRQNYMEVFEQHSPLQLTYQVQELIKRTTK